MQSVQWASRPLPAPRVVVQHKDASCLIGRISQTVILGSYSIGGDTRRAPGTSLVAPRRGCSSGAGRNSNAATFSLESHGQGILCRRQGRHTWNRVRPSPPGAAHAVACRYPIADPPVSREPLCRAQGARSDCRPFRFLIADFPDTMAQVVGEIPH